jgi:signal transduction histidine kinase
LGDVVAREIDAEHLVVAIDGPARGGGTERRYYSLIAAGGVAGMTLIMLQDASPLIGLGTLINRMLSRAEAGADDAARDIVQQLASEVAHLVRNPLASLTLNATMLGTEDPLEKPSDVEAREIVRDIEDAARRIADVVDRLVDVGRGDSSRGPTSSLLGS